MERRIFPLCNRDWCIRLLAISFEPTSCPICLSVCRCLRLGFLFSIHAAWWRRRRRVRIAVNSGAPAGFRRFCRLLSSLHFLKKLHEAAVVGERHGARHGWELERQWASNNGHMPTLGDR